MQSKTGPLSSGKLKGTAKMLFNARCEGCKPVPLTAAVTDHMLDVPPFLRRDLHPELNAVSLAEPGVNHKTEPEKFDTGIDRHRAHETDEDRRQRRHYQNLEAHSAKAVTEQDKAKRAEKREAEKARKADLLKNKLSQRKVFLKDFKWDIDGL